MSRRTRGPGLAVALRSGLSHVATRIQNWTSVLRAGTHRHRLSVIGLGVGVLSIASVLLMEWDRTDVDRVVSLSITSGAGCDRVPIVHLSRVGDESEPLRGRRLRVVVQAVQTLERGKCRGLVVTANMRPERVRIYVPGIGIEPQPWFYVDAVGAYAVEPMPVPAAATTLTTLTLPDAAAERFVGALEFDLPLATSAGRWFEEHLVFNVRVPRTSTETRAGRRAMDVTLRLPPDVQLDLNRALPPPLVVLPASGAIQYEFRVVESLLGNQINSSHWFAVGATAVNDARQQIHGLLLFVLSATFGVGVALLIEGLIARPSET